MLEILNCVIGRYKFKGLYWSVPAMQIMLKKNTIELLSHTPSSGPHGTLFWKKCEQWSMERDKLFFDPIEIVTSLSNTMFVNLTDNCHKTIIG